MKMGGKKWGFTSAAVAVDEQNFLFAMFMNKTWTKPKQKPLYFLCNPYHSSGADKFGLRRNSAVALELKSK